MFSKKSKETLVRKTELTEMETGDESGVGPTIQFLQHGKGL